MLGKTLNRPMNQLVNEALRAYAGRRSAEIERDLEATLTRLRAYREQDPDRESLWRVGLKFTDDCILPV